MLKATTIYCKNLGDNKIKKNSLLSYRVHTLHVPPIYDPNVCNLSRLFCIEAKFRLWIIMQSKKNKKLKIKAKQKYYLEGV